MKTTLHPFAGQTDIQQMLALAHAHLLNPVHLVDLPYRLSSWAMQSPENVGLWVDDDNRLVGWAVMQTPFWKIDSAFLPELGSHFYDEILAWADAQAKSLAGTALGHPCWFVSTSARNEAAIRSLESAGFDCRSDVGEDSWSEVLMCRPAGLSPAPVLLPPGFSIRPLAGQQEVSSYVELHRAVFRSKNMNEAWRSETLRQPAYRPDLDLIAVAPDGQLAAFCIGWFDPMVGWGQIEPLGVGEAYRKHGLGLSILNACLNRLEQIGVEQVLVMPDENSGAQHLYERAGFQNNERILIFGKDYV